MQDTGCLQLKKLLAQLCHGVCVWSSLCCDMNSTKATDACGQSGHHLAVLGVVMDWDVHDAL
jgi:hypothetical protein